MNPILQTIMNHRSVRSYSTEPVADDQIRRIVACAQAASTSSYLQAYTIIGVRDPERKAKLAELAGGQRHVASCPVLLVFCADLRRLELAAEMEGVRPDETAASLESTELFMVALIDASLAAQNAALAAESMGLGICYIGGIRNRLAETAELLRTPDRVIPVFGMTVGYPARTNNRTQSRKQRLPPESVYGEEQYPDSETLKQSLTSYNADISAYYRERTGGERADRWTEQAATRLRRPTRLDVKEILLQRKLPLQ
ncbi:NADPH-dependent oxidoreductase [Cohnella zeiphila]|uniref:NADPH-dependent oxidoreductase n=1 Tax=Cohnella zeiphila TaxID=2761120 RepID=A0A7X0SS92_9BACL|nr:NADPH-dependent oxidoreductase [Cohnella zeiphila]MBB6735177.1 NADPH-dependent oxidoreductase [Cohnella zeiphila]